MVQYKRRSNGGDVEMKNIIRSGIWTLFLYNWVYWAIFLIKRKSLLAWNREGYVGWWMAVWFIMWIVSCIETNTEKDSEKD